MDEGIAASTYKRLSQQSPTTNPTAIRHPERSEVLLRERKRADAKPRSDSDDGIYEGAFVTFQRQSYFPTNTGRRGRRPLRVRATTENSPPSVEGGGEPASRRESFKTKVSFPCNLSHQTSKIQINIVYFAPAVAFCHSILHLLPFTSINFCCIIKTSKENEERI